MPSPGDTATFDFRKIPGYKNQPMTSFSYFAAGDPVLFDPPLSTDYVWTRINYNMLRGFIPFGDIENPTPYRHRDGPFQDRPTKFPLNGDPVTGEGDVDGRGRNLGPADRRFIISSGPFEIQPGDTQEVVFALVGGKTFGEDHLASVREMKRNAAAIKAFYDAEIHIPKITHRVLEAEAGTVEIQVQTDLQRFPNASVVELHFSPEFGSEEAFNLTLFDDGAHNDSLTNDGIWGNLLIANQRKYPFQADLVLQLPAGSATIPNIIENLRLRPSPALENVRLIWENGRQDAIINFEEQAQVQFDIRNPIQAPEIDKIEINRINPVADEENIIVETALPPGEQTQDQLLKFFLNGPAQGDSMMYSYHLRYDRHSEFLSLSFPVAAWQPAPIWKDTIAITEITGRRNNVVALVADPAQLTGHTYHITFATDPSDNQLSWQLFDVTGGQLKLENSPLGTGKGFPFPVTDGILFQVNEINNNFWDFQVIANGAGLLEIPEGAAADFQGFPSAAVTDNQQVGSGRWIIHTQDNNGRSEYGNPNNLEGDNYLSRTTRNGENWKEIVPYDFEMRFTGTSIAWDLFRNGDFIEVPFELWNIGIDTPDDPSDDYRMFPVIVDTYRDGQWGLDDIDHSASDAEDDPQTDWFYWYNPTGHSWEERPGDAAYLAIEDSIQNGTWNEKLGKEALARQVLFNWNGGDVNDPSFPENVNQLLPEEGTIFRIIAAKPNNPGDILELVAPEKSTDIPTIPERFTLHQNFPNPFNNATTIRFDLQESCRVRLEIFNLLGQRLVKLVDGALPANEYTITWDGKNQVGIPSASGVYFYRLTAGGYVESKKMILLK